jgi:hypothetical protein
MARNACFRPFARPPPTCPQTHHAARDVEPRITGQVRPLQFGGMLDFIALVRNPRAEKRLSLEMLCWQENRPERLSISQSVLYSLF